MGRLKKFGKEGKKIKYISIGMISLQNFLPKLLRQEMGGNGKKSSFLPSECGLTPLHRTT